MFPSGHERIVSAVLFLAVVLVGAAIRAPDLDRRAVHTDEAVHAIKFGSLLEEGDYRYDPVDYHGPTLNYATLIPAWLQGASRITDVDERTLRVVPVAFGIALIVPCMSPRLPLSANLVILDLAGAFTLNGPYLL